MTSARTASPDGTGDRLEVAQLGGLWRRSLLIDIDASTDTETEVYWLQGAQSFVDLRQPAGQPDFTSVRCAADLSDEHRQWMSTQAGFAGVLFAGGEFFEWRRSIDLQPRHTSPDAGSLRYDGDVLVEKGWYESYVEHWLRQPATPGPVWELNLTRTDSASALLVRVGSRFGWARSGSDTDGVAEVEIALGTIVEPAAGGLPKPGAKPVKKRIPRSGRKWLIERSSLPYRQGSDLGVRIAETVTTTDARAAGDVVELSWAVSGHDGDRAI